VHHPPSRKTSHWRLPHRGSFKPPFRALAYLPPSLFPRGIMGVSPSYLGTDAYRKLPQHFFEETVLTVPPLVSRASSYIFALAEEGPISKTFFSHEDPIEAFYRNSSSSLSPPPSQIISYSILIMRRPLFFFEAKAPSSRVGLINSNAPPPPLLDLHVHI